MKKQPELHIVPHLSDCEVVGGKRITHTYVRAYKRDGVVPATDKQRWFLLKVCTRCRGYNTYAMTDVDPAKRLDKPDDK